jgi:kumamolisin
LERNNMSEIINPNNMEDKKEDQDDIKARYLFVINESQSGFKLPKGETPASIRRVYNADRCFMGQGQTIVIVGAFHYPTALVDFNVFSRQFGLPLESSRNVLAATNKHFQIIYARGTQPPTEAGWAMESALDVQWAHAMAPCAKIVLVEAASNTYVDLFQAVDVSNAIPNVHVVSMSWGEFEFSGQTAWDVHLKMPGVVYVASSGDAGGNTLYPSVSQYVVSAGGTKINRNACGKFVSETGWTNGGGGPSVFVPIPAWQAAQTTVAAKCGNYRGTPDVAFDVDPTSGVAIYTSTPYNGISGWTTIGGTSLSAPCLAGIIACINERLNKPMTSTAEFLTNIYSIGGSVYYENCFRDITSGQAGTFSCTPGWDFVTGWGTPNIRNLSNILAMLGRLSKLIL